MGNITLHLLMSLITLTLARLSVCQVSPRNFVHSHNVARAKVHVGAISWDETIAAYARDYASQRVRDCKLVHSGGPYGENLAWSSGDLSGTNAVKLWVTEKNNYDYNSNTCAKRKTCKHYTQVVWRNSVRLGCAKVRCITNGTFITCNYDPPGNFIGERPY